MEKQIVFYINGRTHGNYQSALTFQRHDFIATTNEIKYLRTTVLVCSGVQDVVPTPFPGGDGAQDLGDSARSFTVLSEEVKSP